jgi:hypothetical protein
MCLPSDLSHEPRCYVHPVHGLVALLSRHYIAHVPHERGKSRRSHVHRQYVDTVVRKSLFRLVKERRAYLVSKAGREQPM